MTEKELHEIYQNLLDLTKQGMLEWANLGSDTYEINFSRSSITIYFDADLQPYGRAAVMNVYNEDGKLIASSSPLHEESTTVKYFDLDVSELFSLIQSRIYKYSETAKGILEELKKIREEGI